MQTLLKLQTKSFLSFCFLEDSQRVATVFCVLRCTRSSFQQECFSLLSFCCTAISWSISENSARPLVSVASDGNSSPQHAALFPSILLLLMNMWAFVSFSSFLLKLQSLILGDGLWQQREFLFFWATLQEMTGGIRQIPQKSLPPHTWSSLHMFLSSMSLSCKGNVMQTRAADCKFKFACSKPH